MLHRVVRLMVGSDVVFRRLRRLGVLHNSVRLTTFGFMRTVRLGWMRAMPGH